MNKFICIIPVHRTILFFVILLISSNFNPSINLIATFDSIDISSLVTVGANVAMPAIAKKDDGEYSTPDSNGQYKIEIKVNEQGGYARLSSFVLY